MLVFRGVSYTKQKFDKRIFRLFFLEGGWWGGREFPQAVSINMHIRWGFGPEFGPKMLVI